MKVNQDTNHVYILTPLSALCKPVLFLFWSLPVCWKSDITPINKMGAKRDYLKNRPVRVLRIASEIMSTIIDADGKSSIFSKSIIMDHQFGFCASDSTLQKILLHHEKW